MDCQKVGALIRALRQERGMTQRQTADCLGISNKTVSKWENGLGCPDVSLLRELSELLEVDLPTLLSGELSPGERTGGNMKKANYHVCPVCGGVSLTTGTAEITCCGRRLAPLTPRPAEGTERLEVSPVEDELLLTTRHPMTKEHHIAFVALATAERVELVRQYPEWELQVRLPRRRGVLLWYCTKHGLYRQPI